MKFYSIIICLLTSILFGQFQEVNPPKNIKTLQIFNPQTNDNTPIIRIGGQESLIFLFDDTNAISMPEKKAENASVQSIKGMFSKIFYEIIIS